MAFLYLNFSWSFYSDPADPLNDDYFEVYFEDSFGDVYGADGNYGTLLAGGYALSQTAQIDISGLVNNNPLGLTLSDLDLVFEVIPDFWCNPSYLVLDNVSFSAVPIPEPSTFSLFFLAFLLAIPFLKKNRS